jgi:hypothetical protein
MHIHVYSFPFLTTFTFFLGRWKFIKIAHNFLCNWLWNLCESCSYLAHSSCHIHILFGEDDGFWFLFKIDFFEIFVIHVHVSYLLSSPTKSTFILEDDDVVWILFKISFFEIFVIHIHVSCPLASPTKATLILEDDDVFWFLFKTDFFKLFIIHVHVSCILSSPTKSTFILEDDDYFDFSFTLLDLFFNILYLAFDYVLGLHEKIILKFFDWVKISTCQFHVFLLGSRQQHKDMGF